MHKNFLESQHNNLLSADCKFADLWTARNKSTSLLGFTLVEVLVVIAISGIMLGLLLPAVQMAREAARKNTCANNLKQQATAVLLHEEQHGSYPTGGWGASWVGDPDLGYGPKQPGGWIYNVLAFVEQGNLRQLGSGLEEEEKLLALSQLMESPVEIFNCPSRRLARLYPYQGPTTLENAIPPKKVAKSDYAINKMISSEKSVVIVSEIQLQGKGTSNTVAIGEKSLYKSDYSSGQGAGDSLSMYAGDSIDIRRAVSGSPIGDNESSGIGFGGPHPRGCNIAYCDGSIRFILAEHELESESLP